jgi:hypothetical protein
MGRRKHDLLASYLDRCKEIPERQPESFRIESELHQLAITTSQLALASDLEFFLPTSIPPDKECMTFFDEDFVCLDTSYLLWN